MRWKAGTCLAALALLPSLALAHHGQDFLLVESPGGPHPGDVYLLMNSRVALGRDSQEQAELEPALLAGTTPRVSFELHGHTEKLAGAGWRYEATAPAIHVLLTDPENHDGLKVGLGAEYEIAAHQGEFNNSEVRLCFEGRAGSAHWGANLIAGREEGGNSDVGGALGLRRQVRGGFSIGAEAQGSFLRAAGAEALAAVYVERGQSWALKLGLGGERGEVGRFSPVMHVGAVIRLKD